MLYETSADTHYMDYYERALYNHILSTVNPIQGGFVYFTPMRSGHYRVYSQPQTSFWCCVGSGMENHARYGEMIYSHGGADNLYVNLFIPSELTWGKTLITQTNRFPAEEATTITVNPKKPAEFTIRVRIPEWTDASKMQPTVNGQPVEAKAEGGYLAISRKWVKGDKLHVQLQMSLRAVSLPDKSDNYSFMYGPIVLASSLGKQEQLGLFADDSRGGHIAGGRQLTLQDMPVLVADKNNLMANITKVEGRPMTFRLTGAVPEKYAEMTLVPFSSLHECRYMVYWPVVSQQDWQAKQEEIARAEAERQAIEQATADKVICGEQQPESDHFVKMERVRNGDFNGRHWRMAEKGGWFSYDMRTNSQAVKKLQVICSGNDRSDASIQVNGKEVGVINPANVREPQTFTFDLSDVKAKEGILVVKFSPKSKDVTPRFFEVRLMK
jgi:hypothetical protein